MLLGKRKVPRGHDLRHGPFVTCLEKPFLQTHTLLFGILFKGQKAHKVPATWIPPGQA